jgi:cytochrome c
MRGLLTPVALFATSLFVGCLPVAFAQPQKLSRDEALFRNHCVGCHSIRCNRNGPKLLDLIGRRAGAVEDFGYYSAELKESGIVWSEERLSEFLSNPGKLVPGTRMTTVSIKDPKDRRDIIGFIKRQDKSVDLCF